MRNQLLAHSIERDSSESVDKGDFGVCYHADNEDLLRMAPFGSESNPLKAWPKMLRRPENFFAFTVQDLLAAVEADLPDGLLGWRSYLVERYGL